MRVEIELKVTFSTPFIVGTGALASSPADKPTYRDASDRPLIPGSNLKGRVRHACEQILRTLTGQDFSVCRSPRAEFMCPQDPKRLPHREQLPEDYRDYCPVCHIFGGPSRTAAMYFSDLQWELADEWGNMVLPLDIRSNVSIRRARRVSEPERLFTTETFAPTPETVFVGQVSGHLPDEDEKRYPLVALLVAGMRQTTSLGGGRSRGLGHCQIEPAPLEILDELEIPISERRLREALLSWKRKNE